MNHRRTARTTFRFASLCLATALTLTAAAVVLADPALADDSPPTTATPAPLDALVAAHGVLDFVTSVGHGGDPSTGAAAALRQAEATALLVASLPDDGSRLQLLDDSAWLLAFTGTGGHLVTTATARTTDRAAGTAFGRIRTALAQGSVRPSGADGVPYVDSDSVSDTYDSLVATADELVVAAEQVVDAVRHTYVVGNPVPTPDEVVAAATWLVTYLQGTATRLPADLTTAVGTVANALLQQVDIRPLLDQADTVLLYLGSQANPLVDGTAPTREAALTAAEALAGWADAQAGQDRAAGVDYSGSVAPDTSGGLLPATDVMVVGAPEPRPMVKPGTVSAYDTAAQATSGTTGCASSQACAPPLVNPTHSPVQHDPTVYLVFWGPKWTDATHAAQRTALGAFAGGLSGSAFQGVLDQYYDTVGHVGTAVTYGGSFVDARTPPTTTDLADVSLANEAAYARGQNGWRAGRDVQYLIFPQEGSSALGSYGSCGHHNYGTKNGLDYIVSHVPYPTGDFADCLNYAPGNVTATLVLGASHEYAEAVTDPYVGDQKRWAWHDGAGNEIGDMCNIGKPWGTVGGQSVTQLWNNNANGCTYGFGRGASYQVVSTVDPPGAPYARGHAYAGGKVVVRNTGSVAWYTTGAHPIRLMTKNNACSHFYDPPTSDTTTARKDPASTWVNCARVKGTTWDGVVGPGELLAFTLPLRPDGTLPEDSDFRHAETFDLYLEGLSRVTLHDGGYPALGGTIAIHAARRDESDDTTAGKIVPAIAGSTVAVSITTHILGNATWWADEVVDFATVPLGRRSLFAASSWPQPPGVSCTGCRADQVRATTAPGTTYTFKVLLHVPATTTLGAHEELFEPVVDVPIVGGGVATKQLTPKSPVKITLIVLPGVGTHEIVGTGVSGPTAATSAWVACAGAAGADALATTVNWCAVTVHHADGTSASWGWPSEPMPGSAAVTVLASVPYDEAAGDTLEVCWNVSATYPDTSRQTDSGCTS